VKDDNRMERTVLITNLLDVSIDTPFGRIGTRSNALVLEDRGSEEKTGPRYRAYGFRNEAGNSTFDLMLPSLKWTIEPQSYRRAFTLRIAEKPNAEKPDVQMTLTTDFANELPLDIECLEGEAARRSWEDLLLRKVLRYYHAPFIMLGQQHRTELARQAFGVEGVVEV
jgi:hypothetical protein